MGRVIGIDVSQARLDVYCLEDGRRLAVGNDAAGIGTLVGLARARCRRSAGHGGLGRLRARAQRLLSARDLAVAVVNAARVRAFARASGRLAKTHRIDAEVIARYGAFARPSPTPLATGSRQILAELLAYRRQLTPEITARSQQLGHLAAPASPPARLSGARAPACRTAGRHRLIRQRSRTMTTSRRSSRCCRACPASGPRSSPPCSPSCPNSAPSVDAKSPAWSWCRRSPGSAVSRTDAFRSAAATAQSARHSSGRARRLSQPSHPARRLPVPARQR